MHRNKMKKGLIGSLIMLLFIGVPLLVKGQACPACSNPALQSSEKLEAGLDTLEAGSFRLTMNVTSGSNYQGGHPNSKGLNDNGVIITTPLHQHTVSLDFLRTEINVEYTFKTNWSLWLRVPYDIKKQEASVDFTEQATELEKQFILNNRDIHHRTETYAGLSDLRLLMSHRINGFLGKNGRLDMAFGASLPIGKTEENPLVAGDNGLKHLHIQFGSGTFDPLFELHYANSITAKTSLALYTINKFPFYSNQLNYKSAVETTSGVSIGHRISDWLSARGTLASFSQGYAKWNGENDPNSGLVSFNGNIGLTFYAPDGLLLSPGYRFPISQSTLSKEGDTFEYGATFLLNVSYLF